MSVLTAPPIQAPAPSVPPRTPRWIERRRGPVGVSLLVTVLCFLQAPGRVIADTKLDLALDPLNFMQRATHLWDSHQSFGQIQNQAAGYLFPMGPFFALGKLLHVPPWAVQRLWISLLLIVALWGVLRVAEALHIGTPNTRLLGATVYALSPAMLGVVGIASGGQLPTALAPWVLLPLILHREGDSRIRTAALSGLAVAAMGGVNAISTGAVLVIPLLWLLTRSRDDARRYLLRWWLLAVVVGTFWWIGPLLLQARFGYNFLHFTEDAALTTQSSSLFETTRGTGYWLGYLNLGVPWLRGAWTYVSEAPVILATALLAAGGLYGLARRDIKERRFLVLTVLVGVIVVTAGYSGPLSAPIGSGVRGLLDGVLSPLRNLNKFEPLIRLPLALGLMAVLPSLSWPPFRRVAAAALVVLLIIAAAPLWQGNLAPVGTFAKLPSYWTAASHWLDSRAGPGSTLVVPSAAFGEYQWGRPLDEPMQAIAKRPWAVRNLIPLGSAGATRLMDTVERQLESGTPSAELAAFLSRAGVRFVLLRNDLDAARTGSPAPAYLRRALDESPGMLPVAQFGPRVKSIAVNDRLVPDLGRSVRDRPPRSLEVYELYARPKQATAYAQANTVGVSGAPDGLLSMAGDPAFNSQATSLLGDPYGVSKPVEGDVVTDAVRRRDVKPGGVRDNASYALTATEKASGETKAPQDGAVLQDDAHRSVVRMAGATDISASSYDGPLAENPERQPYAAFDNDPSTAWVTGSFTGPAHQWIQIDLAQSISPPTVTVQLFADHPWRPRPTAVTVSTERGAVTWPVLGVETPQDLVAPQGPTQWVRITIADALYPFGGGGGAGFREIKVPGVSVDRTLALPAENRAATASAPPRTVLLDRSHTDPYDAVREDEEARLDRLFTLPSAEDVDISGTVLPVPGTALDKLIADSTPASALTTTARSTWGNIPAFGVSRLFDGDPTTAWLASADDPSPTLDLSWPDVRTVDSVDLTQADGPVLRPTRVDITGAGGSARVDVPPDGHVRFPALQTNHLVVTVVTSERAPAAANVGGLVTGPPLAIAELRVPALDDLRPQALDLDTPVHLGCGEGPTIDVDGRNVQTAVDGTLQDLVELRSLRTTACGGPFRLAAGEHRFASGTPGDALVLTTARVGQPASAAKAPTPMPDTTVRRWGTEKRVVHVGAGAASYLALDENFNPGWKATLHGSSLKSVRLDGWRQAFAVPAGKGGDVSISFSPGRTYLLLLIAGLLLLALLACAALAPTRRWERGPAARKPGAPAGTDFVATPIFPAVGVYAGVCLLGLVLAGVAGGIIAAVLTTAVVISRRWSLLPVVAGGAFVLAALAAIRNPGASPLSDVGAFGGPVQALALIAVLALALTLVPRKEAEA